jgi:hypothetical protein
VINGRVLRLLPTPAGILIGLHQVRARVTPASAQNAMCGRIRPLPLPLCQAEMRHRGTGRTHRVGRGRSIDRGQQRDQAGPAGGP